MSRIWSIAKRDFSFFIISPLFFILAGLSTLYFSFTFLKQLIDFSMKTAMFAAPQFAEKGYVLNIHYQVFLPHISVTHIILLFVIPAITMRSLSEEYKNKTMDLLLSSPVSSTQITLAKFLGAYLSVLMILLLSILYPLMCYFVADFTLAPLLVSYLGLLLLAGCYVSIGLFISSLTQSVFLSLIIGIILNLILITTLAQLPQLTDNPYFLELFKYISPGLQFNYFLKGMIQSHSLVYFASFMFFFVFLVQRVIESKRWR